MEAQESDPSNPVPSNKTADKIIEGEYTVIEDRAPQNQTSRPLSTKLPEKKIKPEFDDPDQLIQKLIYGRILVPKDKSQEPEVTQNSEQKPPGKRLEFDSPDVMVQKLVYGRPLVVKKEPQDTAKEEFAADEPQPEPEPEPTAVLLPAPVSVNQEAIQVDHERANRFYDQLDQASKNIDDQTNILNLQAIKRLNEFKEVDTAIQDLASEYSQENFDLQDYHLLSLEGISEKLATELEETNGWDKTVHQENVAAVGLALNFEITSRASQISGQNQASQEQIVETSIPSTEPVQPPSLLAQEDVRSAPPTSERITPPSPEPLPSYTEPVVESKLERPIIIPDNTPGNNFEKVVNHILEDSQDSTEQIGVSPDVLIQYLKHTIKFRSGVGFNGTPSARIEKAEGKNILITKGSIRGGIGPITIGEANFTITLGNNDQGGVEIIDKSIDYSGEATKNKAEVEEKLGSLNQTIIDQMNGRLNQLWEVANFRIDDDKLIFDFRKKQQ